MYYIGVNGYFFVLNGKGISKNGQTLKYSLTVNCS